MNPKPSKKLSLGAESYVTFTWKGFLTQFQLFLSSIVELTHCLEWRFVIKVVYSVYNLSYVSDENISDHFLDFFFAKIYVNTIQIFIFFVTKFFQGNQAQNTA